MRSPRETAVRQRRAALLSAGCGAVPRRSGYRSGSARSSALRSFRRVGEGAWSPPAHRHERSPPPAQKTGSGRPPAGRWRRRNAAPKCPLGILPARPRPADARASRPAGRRRSEAGPPAQRPVRSPNDISCSMTSSVAGKTGSGVSPASPTPADEPGEGFAPAVIVLSSDALGRTRTSTHSEYHSDVTNAVTSGRMRGHRPGPARTARTPSDLRKRHEAARAGS